MSTLRVYSTNGLEVNLDDNTLVQLTEQSKRVLLDTVHFYNGELNLEKILVQSSLKISTIYISRLLSVNLKTAELLVKDALDRRSCYSETGRNQFNRSDAVG